MRAGSPSVLIVARGAIRPTSSRSISATRVEPLHLPVRRYRVSPERSRSQSTEASQSTHARSLNLKTRCSPLHKDEKGSNVSAPSPTASMDLYVSALGGFGVGRKRLMQTYPISCDGLTQRERGTQSYTRGSVYRVGSATRDQCPEGEPCPKR